jgi:hypothetical protein
MAHLYTASHRAVKQALDLFLRPLSREIDKPPIGRYNVPHLKGVALRASTIGRASPMLADGPQDNFNR